MRIHVPWQLRSCGNTIRSQNRGEIRKCNRYHVTMKPDWNAIKSEYITTSISYRKLAAKYNMPRRTIEDKAKKELWTADRDEYRGKTVAATVKRVSRKTSEDNAKKLLKLQGAADSLAGVINEVFTDSEQFKRHIVTEGLGMGETRVGERVMKKVDTKAIKDLTGALKDLAYVMRDIYDLPTKQEQSAMDIAAERLRLDQAKVQADSGDDGAGAGVVVIAPVLDEEAEKDG